MASSDQQLSPLAAKLASLIHNHFQVDGQPPPPCPGSLLAIIALFDCLRRLDAATLATSAGFSGGWDEAWRREAIGRLRSVVDAIRKHFAPFGKGAGFKWDAIPPVDGQLFRALIWASETLATAAIDDDEGGPIPPKYRTRPMTLSEAATYLGQKGKKRGEWLSNCIKDGTVRCEGLNRQSRVFDKRQFPESVWPKITPR